MEDRKQKVLAAIVDDYISTADPVGSRTIARKYKLGVSPATIRNEMADLEELGLIEQPHTSAGRIPSDKGYRYYVDYLMGKYIPDQKEETLIREMFRQKMQATEKMIQGAIDVLSRLTSCVAVVLGPQMGHSTIRRLQLIPLEPGRVLLVMILTTGLVQNRILEVPEGVSEKDLEKISMVLNNKLMGLTMGGVSRTALQGIRQELTRDKEILEIIFQYLEDFLSPEREEKVYLGGALNMIRQPEFQNIERLQSLFSLLEEGGVMRELLYSTLGRGFTVRIGGENKNEKIHDLSLVTGAYEIRGEVVGTIGLMGPTRMDYSRAIALVEYVNLYLSESLNKLFR